MVLNYVPEQGDICYLDFAPTKGHEQSGLRPAIVISRDEYNKFTNMAIVCPITSNIKKFPTHYILKDTYKINGAVLCEHVRSIDYKYRKISFVEKISQDELKAIIEKVYGLILVK